MVKKFGVIPCTLWLQRHWLATLFICTEINRGPGPRFNIKMSSYQYRKSHCGDKTVVRSSYLHNGIPYTGKMSSLYWIRALVYADLGLVQCDTFHLVGKMVRIYKRYCKTYDLTHIKPTGQNSMRMQHQNNDGSFCWPQITCLRPSAAQPGPPAGTRMHTPGHQQCPQGMHAAVNPRPHMQGYHQPFPQQLL